MAKCPACKKEFEEHTEAWKFGQFDVKAYTCECGTGFREYHLKGKHSFTLKISEGKGFVKA